VEYAHPNTDRALKIAAQLALAMQPDLTVLADEHGPLYFEVEILKAKERRLEVLNEVFRRAHDNSPSHVGVKIVGKKWTVTLGPCSVRRKITDIRKVWRILKATFWEHAVIPLEVIDDWYKGKDPVTTAKQQKTFLSEGLNGARPVKAIPNPEASK
jgi:hypothetical protein